MGDVGQGAELVLEPVERARGHLAQGLQGHDRATVPVQDLVDDAEAAGTEAAPHLEPARAFEVFGRP